MNIKDFISSEKSYFEPMLERAIKFSEEQRILWRKETVAQRQERVSLELFDLLGGCVKYGPFRGLKLQKNTWWGKSDLGSMLMGFYEKEILDFIDSIEAGQFSTFIDIGAADGYYACGLLHSKKIRKAVCFEKSELGRNVIKNNWLNNDSCGELEIIGEANIDTIKALPTSSLKNSLILVDIEGYEFELLTDSVLSTFSNCTIIIEIHNWIDDFLVKYENLLINASKYFNIEPIQQVERSTSTYPELRDLTDDNRLLLVSERRPCLMRFLKLTPLAK